MIESSGTWTNSEGNKKPELPNDNVILDAPTQSNIVEGHDVMLDVWSRSPSCSSAVSQTMTMSTSALENGEESWPTQNLYMMNEIPTQLTLEDTQLIEAQKDQPIASEQLGQNILPHNSKLNVLSATHSTCGCLRGVPLTYLNSPRKLDQCDTINYCSTLDPCLAITPELPPVLHLHKNPIAIPFPDGLSAVISPYPDPLAISEIIKPSLSANTSSSGVPMSVRKLEKNFAHEVAINSVEAGIAVGEFEYAKSKYDDNGPMNLFLSLHGPKAQISKKIHRKQPADLHLIGTTQNNLDDAKIQNQHCAQIAFPMQHETHQRTPSGNCWLHCLRLLNSRFPLIKYRLVNTKVITICLSYGLLMSASPENEGFLIREDGLEGRKMKMYASSWKSGGPEKTKSLECGRQFGEHDMVAEM